MGHECKRHGYDKQGYEIIQVLKNFKPGNDSPCPYNDISPESEINDVSNAQSNTISNIFSGTTEGSTNNWKPPPPLRQDKLRGLLQPMDLSPNAHNTWANTYSKHREFGNGFETRLLSHQPKDNNTLQDSTEAATYREILRLFSGVSPNYSGNLDLVANRSANIPDELNTAVWIENLPPNLTHKMLLDSVRNCGKVYATVINGPAQQHTTSASKLVFFDVAGAQNLLRQAREGTFIVDGYVPDVRHNRIKSEAKRPGPHSRVLHIEGPTCIVNERYLADLFREDNITWQNEEVLTLSSNERLT